MTRETFDALDGRGDDDWESRRRFWQGKLRPIRLDAEPIQEQLAKRRTVLFVLTGVAMGVVSIIFGLFTAFGRPDIGAWVALVFLTPILAVAWFDFALLSARIRSFQNEVEQREFERTTPRPGGS